MKKVNIIPQSHTPPTPQAAPAAATSRWIPEQMKDSRQEESSILVTSSSGSKKCSSRIATWQEFYSDGVGEIKMRKVIDMGLIRTGRLARTRTKMINTISTISTEDEAAGKNKQEENSEVRKLKRQFEVEIETEEESTQIARTKAKNKVWKKTNPEKVKTESSKKRQEKATNSPKTPRLKRLNQSKLNRTLAKPKMLPLKPEETLSKFEKLLQDWEHSKN